MYGKQIWGLKAQHVKKQMWILDASYVVLHMLFWKSSKGNDFCLMLLHCPYPQIISFK